MYDTRPLDPREHVTKELKTTTVIIVIIDLKQTDRNAKYISIKYSTVHVNSAGLDTQRHLSILVAGDIYYYCTQLCYRPGP